MNDPVGASSVPPQALVRVLFEGRYRKMVRNLPQTIFYCPDCKGRGCERCEGYGKLTKDSVQELIARVAMPWFKARRNKFHGAGREDIDVRMLGTGRPFVFEMLKVKRPNVVLEELASEINRRAEGRMEILDLQYCGRKRVPEIKERQCPKEYRARVAFSEQPDPVLLNERLEELSAQGRLSVIQSTPARVAHRRAKKDRERWIEVKEWEDEGDTWTVSLCSAHGTYIKEAVSGEEGRTRPSLSELLGVSCTCVELDVLSILPPEADGSV